MKHYFLFMFVVFGLSLSAQTKNGDCLAHVIQKEDEVTGEKTVAIKSFIKVVKGSESVTFFLNRSPGEKSVFLLLKVTGSSPCIDEGEKANILFTDGTRIEIQNQSDFSCDGTFSLFIVDDETSTLTNLCIKPIKTIRVWTAKGYVEVDIPLAKAKSLMSAFLCTRYWTFE